MSLYQGEEFPAFNSGATAHPFNFQAFLLPKGAEKKSRKETVVKLTKKPQTKTKTKPPKSNQPKKPDTKTPTKQKNPKQ